MKYNCIPCDYNTDHKVKYEIHLKSKKHERKGNKITHKCEKCDYVTNDISNFKKHNMIHNGKINYKYKCTVCESNIVDNYNLARHLLKKKHKDNVINSDINNCKQIGDVYADKVDMKKINNYIVPLKDGYKLDLKDIIDKQKKTVGIDRKYKTNKINIISDIKEKKEKINKIDNNNEEYDKESDKELIKESNFDAVKKRINNLIKEITDKDTKNDCTNDLKIILSSNTDKIDMMVSLDSMECDLIEYLSIQDKLKERLKRINYLIKEIFDDDVKNYWENDLKIILKEDNTDMFDRLKNLEHKLEEYLSNQNKI